MISDVHIRLFGHTRSMCVFATRYSFCATEFAAGISRASFRKSGVKDLGCKILRPLPYTRNLIVVDPKTGRPGNGITGPPFLNLQ